MPMNAAPDSMPATSPPSTVKRIYLPAVIFGLLVLASTASNNGPANFSVVDAILLFSIVAYLVGVWRFKNELFTQLVRQVGTPILLVLVLGLGLLTFLGGIPLILAKDLFAFGYLFVGLALLLKSARPVSLKPVFIFLWIGLAVLLVSVLLDTGTRRSGLMPNPNLTSAWFAGCLLVVLISREPRSIVLRTGVILASGYGLTQSGSLGSLVALAAALLLWALTRSESLKRFAIPLSALSVAAGIAALPYLERLTRTAQETGNSRIESSSGAREYIWGEAFNFWLRNPLGGGPGSFGIYWSTNIGSTQADTHNNYLGLLVNVGIIGLLLWLFALWRLFQLSGAGAPLVLYIAVSSLTNDSLNMRSNWLFLALLIAWQYLNTVSSKPLPTEPGRAPPRLAVSTPGRSPR